MVFAIAAIMSLGTAGAALAQSHKSPGCDNSGKGSHKNCGGDDKKGDKGDKGKKCKEGESRKHGKCEADKPPKCEAGEMRDAQEGKCVPIPVGCDDDEINVDGTCVPRPNEGVCSKASIVLLEDLLKGTGALACVFLGDNAPKASAMGSGNCHGALLALPLDHLIGACLFLPPADVHSTPMGGGGGGEENGAGAPQAPALNLIGSPADVTKPLVKLVSSIVSTLTGLLDLGH